MKKTIALILVVFMVATAMLAGCASSATPTAGPTAVPTAEPTLAPATITINSWGMLTVQIMKEGLQNIFPQITIEYSAPATEKWGNEALLEWAAAGVLPDIVMVSNPDIVIQNDLVIDLKPYFDADPDNVNLYPGMAECATVNGKMIMLPESMYFYGVMVNKDLVAEQGLEVPDYGWTIDEYVNIVKECNKPGEILGANDSLIWPFLVPNLNPDVEIGGYNRATKQWELDESWIKAVDTIAELALDGYTGADRLAGLEVGSDAFKAKSKEICGYDDPWYACLAGNMATYLWPTYWGTYADYGEYAGFDYDLYPIPVAKKGDVSRTPIVTDSYGITTACENPAQAYEVIKYFTYSKEGFITKMDAVENFDQAALKAKYPEIDTAQPIPEKWWYPLSPVDDQVLRDRWAEIHKPLPGVKYLVDNLNESNPYIEGFKVIPGWTEVSGAIIEPAVNSQIFTGEKTAADLAAELQTAANTKQAEVFASLD
ncbi:MAG: ABC transporter substrate-binding protein [Saccharofermentanales bacterium]